MHEKYERPDHVFELDLVQVSKWLKFGTFTAFFLA